MYVSFLKEPYFVREGSSQMLTVWEKKKFVLARRFYDHQPEVGKTFDSSLCQYGIFTVYWILNRIIKGFDEFVFFT